MIKEAQARGVEIEQVQAEHHARRRQSIERSAEMEDARHLARERAWEQNEERDRRRRMGRREFLRRGVIIGGATAAASAFGFAYIPERSEAKGLRKRRVVVVGAGMAGLTAAYRINKSAGIPVAVYEAQERVGGRMHSDRAAFAGGRPFEHGGNGLDTTHTDKFSHPIGSPNAQNLGKLVVTELNMGPLVDLWNNYPEPAGPFYRYNGANQSGFAAGMVTMVNAATAQWATVGWPAYTNSRMFPTPNANAIAYDNMTVEQWINANHPGGIGHWVGESYAHQHAEAFGGRANDTSALTALMELGGNWLFDENAREDARWGIPVPGLGGTNAPVYSNDGVCRRIKQSYLPQGSVTHGHALTAIKLKSDGTYRLTFNIVRSSGAGVTYTSQYVDVVAEHVIITLSPPCLKQVDLTQSGFNALAMKWINDEPNGTNRKVMLQFTGAPVGDVFSDVPLMGTCWGENINNGNATQINFSNAVQPTAAARPDICGPADAGTINAILPTLNTLFTPDPGPLHNTGPGGTGLSWEHLWVKDPWALGSYVYHRPGGFVNYAGAEKVPQGALHFAGEHTADWQERGYMHGAYQSGERAASEVLADLT